MNDTFVINDAVRLAVDYDQIKLERDQAVAALRLILEVSPELFKVIDAIHAARTLLTRLEVK